MLGFTDTRSRYPPTESVYEDVTCNTVKTVARLTQNRQAFSSGSFLNT